MAKLCIVIIRSVDMNEFRSAKKMKKKKNNTKKNISLGESCSVSLRRYKFNSDI